MLLNISIVIVWLPAQDCITGSCHQTMVEFSQIHSPVDDNDCAVCHSDNGKEHPDSRGKEFTLESEDIGELCGSCHEIDKEGIHDPVAKGKCITCHDPHANNNSFLLIEEDLSILCNQCHEPVISDRKYTHGPAAVGACNICHFAHGATQNSLITTDEINQLCYTCHTLKEQEISRLEHIHTPVQNSCVDCHNPHESDYKYLLSLSNPEACLTCHEDIRNRMKNALSQHAALVEEELCLNCHTPHGSNYKYNLKDQTFDLCLSCHNQDFKKDDHTIPNMDNYLKENAEWHGPIRDKDCSGCHDPHGSENISLLHYYFPLEFYSPFDVDNYQLCFQCHPETNVLDASTVRMTGFRDGDRNLHYLHVNQEKGRTCRACHQVHASQLPFHVREAVPFGGWQLPINYSPTRDGGSCTPGCHKHFEYKRTKN